MPRAEGVVLRVGPLDEELLLAGGCLGSGAGELLQVELQRWGDRLLHRPSCETGSGRQTWARSAVTMCAGVVEERFTAMLLKSGAENFRRCANVDCPVGLACGEFTGRRQLSKVSDFPVICDGVVRKGAAFASSGKLVPQLEALGGDRPLRARRAAATDAAMSTTGFTSAKPI